MNKLNKNYISGVMEEFDEKATWEKFGRQRTFIQKKFVKTFLKQKFQECEKRKVEEIRSEIKGFIANDEELKLSKEIGIGLRNDVERQNHLCNRILNLKSLTK